MGNIRVHLIIEGRVQGVWFRESTRKKAVSLGLAGWVKNRVDGTVEVIAEGPEGRINQLAAWCRNGPPMARVDQVQEMRKEYKGEFSSFDVVYG
jgi:acylphosphatase